MGNIEKPWGYEEQVLMTQVDVGDKTGMLGIRIAVINTDEMTSYSYHEEQSDILYLEEGEVVLRLEDDIEELEPGKAKIVRSEQKHQIQNIGTEPARVLTISFPYIPDDRHLVEDPYSEEAQAEQD